MDCTARQAHSLLDLQLCFMFIASQLTILTYYTVSTWSANLCLSSKSEAKHSHVERLVVHVHLGGLFGHLPEENESTLGSCDLCDMQTYTSVASSSQIGSSLEVNGQQQVLVKSSASAGRDLLKTLLQK